jgi:hypothetical protein
MKRTWWALLGALVSTACSSSGDSSDAASSSSPDASSSPATDADGGASGPAGEGSTAPPDNHPIAKNLALSAVSFKNVGRYGEALRVAVKGADTGKQTSAMFVRFVDSADQPVIALDTDWDGAPDAAERRFHFDTSTLGQASFIGSVVIQGVFSPSSKIAKVIVSLVDEAGGRSASMAQAITLQATRAEGEACDPNKVVDRCADGLGCGGAPSSTCLAGVAPVVSRIGYFGGNAPRMVFQGSEPDEDIDEVAIEFLDAAGNPKSVNLGTDDDPSMGSGLTLDAKLGVEGTSFSVVSTPIKGFEQQAPKIAATVSDGHGHRSTRAVAAASSMPVRGVGQVCDWAGFDACSAGNVCSPGLPTTENKCASAAPLRASRCSAGPILEPSKGIKQAFGTTAGASLWDAPSGCVGNDATGRPESTVRLRLATAAPTLVITTALPETDFDTAVYLLPGCPASSAAALGCNDDERGTSSTLTLKNVPAGDYTIVVESVKPRAGRFGVSVEVK